MTYASVYLFSIMAKFQSHCIRLMFIPAPKFGSCFCALQVKKNRDSCPKCLFNTIFVWYIATDVYRLLRKTHYSNDLSSELHNKLALRHFRTKEHLKKIAFSSFDSYLSPLPSDVPVALTAFGRTGWTTAAQMR